jgi:hypothetical protein
MNAATRPGPAPRVGVVLPIALMVLASAGCTRRTYYVCIGSVSVAGDHVQVDGKPATNGMKIRSGSVVTTGPASSALIDLAGGGTLQLDENTDPEFHMILRGKPVERVDEDQCEIRIEKINGRVAGHATKCVLTVSSEIGPLTFQPEGEFNLSVEGPVATLTTREGQSNVEQPANVTLWPRQQLRARDARASSPTSPPRGDLDEIFRWQTKYKFPTRDAANGKIIYTEPGP